MKGRVDVRPHETGFKTFADALPGSLCLLDAAGDITWVNAGWMRFAAENGYAGPPFVKVNYLVVCGASEGAERDDARDVCNGVMQVLRGGRPSFTYTYACHGPSERRWFLLSAGPLDGGALVLHLRASPPAIAPQMAASRLFNRIAQELQTPLSTVAGFAQLIADGAAGQTSELARDYARQIQGASERLSGIVDNILDLSRATDKTVQLNEVDTPVEELVTLARALVRRDAEHLGTTVDVVLSCRAVLLCDPQRMTQVLVNLLDNAIKFSPPGSRVVVSAAPEDGEGCRVEVRDHGMGMAAHEIAAALRPYGRTAAAQASDIAGLGLGLPLARALVELHGGGWTSPASPPREPPSRSACHAGGS